MIDLEINLRRLSRSALWLVEIRSTEYPTVLEVPPLTDQDLAEVPDLAPEARSWKGFLASLSPGSPLPPGPAALRTVGGIRSSITKTDLTWERWKRVRDVIDAIEPAPWSQGALARPLWALARSPGFQPGAERAESIPNPP